MPFSFSRKLRGVFYFFANFAFFTAKIKYLSADTAAIQLFELTFLRNWFFVLPAVARGRATSKGGFPLRRFGMHASNKA